ncbi:MAG: hypothetical protein ACPIE8_09420, partial [Henriciella sp.]
MALVKKVIVSGAVGALVWPFATAQMIDQIATRDAVRALDDCMAAGTTELQCKRDLPANLMAGLSTDEDVRFQPISVFGVSGLDRAGNSSIISARDIADL